MNNGKCLFTVQGFEELKKTHDDLIEHDLPKAIARLKNAREQGDSIENSDLEAATEALEVLNYRIAELKNSLASAQVADKKQSKGSADIGMQVTLDHQGDTCVYSLVGEMEANPIEKKISVISPLGKALLGKRVGDQLKVKAPAGISLYTILGIQ